MSEKVEAIILAGGLGTRLKGKVPDLPKCMAPVSGKPFIDYVIHYLLNQGITRIIFSLGYKSEHVINHLEKNHPDLDYAICIEEQPLGTGGAALLASKQILGNDFLLLNGDTLFLADIKELQLIHSISKAKITLALKPMSHFNRYGSVITDSSNQVTAFMEKKEVERGHINGGIYLINHAWFHSLSLPEVFSFEKDILEKQVTNHVLFSSISDAYFIDIGIPEDYEKANQDLAGFL